MSASKSKLVGALLLLSSLPACSDRGAASNPRKVVDSSGGTVALGIGSARSYRESAAGNGAVQGTISVQGSVTDSTIAVAAKDAKTCGDSANVHETISDIDVAGFWLSEASFSGGTDGRPRWLTDSGTVAFRARYDDGFRMV